MQFTDEIRQKIDAHFKRLRLAPCPVCGGANREMQETVIAASLHNTETSLPGPDFYPALTLVCATCFNVQLFALAPILGIECLFPPRPEPEAEKPAKGKREPKKALRKRQLTVK